MDKIFGENSLTKSLALLFSSYLAIDLGIKVYQSYKKPELSKEMINLLQSQINRKNSQDSDFSVLRKQIKDFQKSEYTTLRGHNIQDDKFSNTLQKLPIKIVLTGGPCSGKTTALSKLQDLLLSKGFKVYIVPEAATLLSQGGAGIDMSTWTVDKKLSFQANLMNLQRNLEDRFSQIAELNSNSKQNSVLICDRGMMDGKAYLDDANWDILLDEMDIKESDIKEKRYDAIIHLVTSANGAEQFYNLDNQARYESNLQQAIETDQKTQRAWQGHPSHIIISSNENFGFKMQKTCEYCLKYCGVQTAQLIFAKKYFINDPNFDISKIQKNNEGIEAYIHQDNYLKEQDSSYNRKIKKRGQKEIFTYYLIESRKAQEQNSQTRRRITAKRYQNLLSFIDPEFRSLTRVRHCFNDALQTYQIDQYLNEDKKIMFTILMILVQEDAKQAELPEFCKNIPLIDITDNPKFFSKNIAKKNWKLEIPKSN